MFFLFTYQTPIHYAVANGSEVCITFLLDYGADINLMDKNGVS